MTFNIGSQHAGVVNNVAGDQTVHGGQHAYLMAPPEVMDAVRALRVQVGDLALPPADHARVNADLAEIDHQLQSGRIAHHDLADRLSRLLATARRAGALITSTSSLGTAVSTIAHWLGPAGATLLQLLA